jgi:hypothetical protein
MKTQFWWILPLCVGLIMVRCSKPVVMEKMPIGAVQQEVQKFMPVDLSADFSSIPPDEVETLRLLVKASRIMDELFLRQVDERNPSIRMELSNPADPENRPYLDLFSIMFGSWNRIDGDKPFLNSKSKPEGAAFYPEDMTKDEFEKTIGAHPEWRETFEGNFTVIRRKDGVLRAVPYSDVYAKWLNPAADLLRRAAETTRGEPLKRFLKSRADAFFSNDYFASDMDWMDLSGDIECVIGPYEVYEDKLFGYKAAFEAFVCVVDREESARWKALEERLPDLEKALPMPPGVESSPHGVSSPIKVVDLAFSAGDAKAGVQTAAFNLPNDERVRAAKGSKKVMLRNVMRAKFDKCWTPIARRLLAPDVFDRVAFEAYFTETLMHEMAHALGPGVLRKNGRETTVNKELKDMHATVEECKADVVGLYTTQLLIDWGVFPDSLNRTLFATDLGGMFRSIRFGIDEAHGGGVAIQLNYYLDQGAFRVTPDGLFGLDERRMRIAVESLARELLALEAAGDYASAARFVGKYRTLRPEVKRALEWVSDVPVDIRPVYTIEIR